MNWNDYTAEHKKLIVKKLSNVAVKPLNLFMGI